MSTNNAIMPLFPLSTVMFPGARFPLQIFEPRYMDMVTECLRNNSEFCIVQLLAGTEVAAQFGQPPSFEYIGCSVRIVDWDALPHNRLGIVVEGVRKVDVVNTYRNDNNLNIGEVEFLPDEPDCELPESYLTLWELLETLSQHETIQKLGIVFDSRSSINVANHLATLLPIENEQKQALLELNNPLDRLEELATIVAKLES